VNVELADFDPERQLCRDFTTCNPNTVGRLVLALDAAGEKRIPFVSISMPVLTEVEIKNQPDIASTEDDALVDKLIRQGVTSMTSGSGHAAGFTRRTRLRSVRHEQTIADATVMPNEQASGLLI